MILKTCYYLHYTNLLYYFNYKFISTQIKTNIENKWKTKSHAKYSLVEREFCSIGNMSLYGNGFEYVNE